jgi:hypothetical protein
MTMPIPTNTTSVSLDGRSIYPTIAGQTQHVAPLHDGVGEEGDLLAAAYQLLEHDASAVLDRQIDQRTVAKPTAGDDHVRRCERYVEQARVRHLLANRAAAGREHAAAPRHRDDVTVAKLCVGSRLCGHAISTQPFDEHPCGSERSLDVSDETGRAANAVGAAIPLTERR